MEENKKISNKIKVMIVVLAVYSVVFFIVQANLKNFNLVFLKWFEVFSYNVMLIDTIILIKIININNWKKIVIIALLDFIVIFLLIFICRSSFF